MVNLMVNKLVIFGVGLIGGSFAVALRRAGAVGEVVGVGRSAANLKLALEMGVVDRAESDLAAALRGADLVLLAVPVGQVPRVMADIAPYLETQTVVTDAGSTKQDVVAAAARLLADHLDRFVPAHPIAGAEQSGVGAASGELFQGRHLIITPSTGTRSDAVALVRSLWEACGAKVSTMSPQTHDETFAAVSHLPHMLAFALVDELAARPDGAAFFRFAAGGFRDFTRIAGSSPEMWRDICLANREALLREVDAYLNHLGQLRELLEAGDGAALERHFALARDARRKYLLEK